MSGECGIVVFADDELPERESEIEVELPSHMTYGEPCERAGHADSLGRGLRSAKDRKCLVCGRVAAAKHAGRETSEDVDEIVAVELARARRKIEDERRKEAKRIARAERERERKIADTKRRAALRAPRGKSGTPSGAMLVAGTSCESCGKELTRAAVEGGSRACSRMCAGLVIAPSGRGTVDAEPDVSDAELAEIGS